METEEKILRNNIFNKKDILDAYKSGQKDLIDDMKKEDIFSINGDYITTQYSIFFKKKNIGKGKHIKP